MFEGAEQPDRIDSSAAQAPWSLRGATLTDPDGSNITVDVGIEQLAGFPDTASFQIGLSTVRPERRAHTKARQHALRVASGNMICVYFSLQLPLGCDSLSSPCHFYASGGFRAATFRVTLSSEAPLADYFVTLHDQDLLMPGYSASYKKWAAVTTATEVHVGSSDLRPGSTQGQPPLFAENVAGESYGLDLSGVDSRTQAVFKVKNTREFDLVFGGLISGSSAFPVRVNDNRCFSLSKASFTPTCDRSASCSSHSPPPPPPVPPFAASSLSYSQVRDLADSQGRTLIGMLKNQRATALQQVNTWFQPIFQELFHGFVHSNEGKPLYFFNPDDRLDSKNYEAPQDGALFGSDVDYTFWNSIDWDCSSWRWADFDFNFYDFPGLMRNKWHFVGVHSAWNQPPCLQSILDSEGTILPFLKRHVEHVCARWGHRIVAVSAAKLQVSNLSQ